MSSSLYQHGTLERFFPSSDTASAAVVALLVRCDELRLFTRRIQEMQGDSPDVAFERLALFRAAVVSADDAWEQICWLISKERFRNAIAADPRRLEGACFAIERFAEVRDALSVVRDKTGAHIDRRALRRAMRLHGEDLRGGWWFSGAREGWRFDLAHFALAAIYVGDGPAELGPGSRAADIVDQCTMARDAAYLALLPFLDAYNSLTGSLSVR